MADADEGERGWVMAWLKVCRLAVILSFRMVWLSFHVQNKDEIINNISFIVYEPSMPPLALPDPVTMAASERLHLGTATNLLKHLMLPVACVCEVQVEEQGQRGRHWWADH